MLNRYVKTIAALGVMAWILAGCASSPTPLVASDGMKVATIRAEGMT